MSSKRKATQPRKFEGFLPPRQTQFTDLPAQALVQSGDLNARDVRRMSTVSRGFRGMADETGLRDVRGGPARRRRRAQGRAQEFTAFQQRSRADPATAEIREDLGEEASFMRMLPPFAKRVAKQKGRSFPTLGILNRIRRNPTGGSFGVRT